jgi:hypothetical protein
VTLRRRSCLSLAIALGLVGPGCRDRVGPAREHALAITPAMLDLGLLTQNETMHATVELSNAGATAVGLRAPAPTTRCRWDALPHAIAARTTIPLAVACQSDLLGRLEEELTILDSMRSDAVATLRIAGRVEPIIGFDTAFVDLRPEFGRTTSVDVHLVGKQVAQAAPVVASTGGEVVTVAALSLETGRTRGFRVSCKGQHVGMHAGSLLVDTGIPAQPQLVLSWGCRVPATLEVEPTNPYFNLHISGDRATTIVVRSRQPGFKVQAAQVIEGPFRADVEKKKPDGSTPITIRVKNSEIPDESRSASGTLLIESNDEREPHKEVPLFGFGRVNKVDQPRAN